MSAGRLSEDALAPIRASFFEECEELLGELETGLLALQDGAREQDVVDAVFRAVHSIKGGAGAFGLETLVRFAHGFESALDGVRAKTVAIDAELMRLLLKAADVLADIVRDAREGRDAAPDDAETLLSALAAVTPEADAADDAFEFEFTPTPATLDLDGPPAPRCVTIRLRPHARLYATANDPLMLLRELGRLGEMAVELDQDALPALDQLEPEEAYLGWTVRLTTAAGEAEVREVFDFVEGDCDLDVEIEDVGFEAPEIEGPQIEGPQIEGPQIEGSAQAEAVVDPPPGPEARHETAGVQAQSIRVDLERIDRLINLVGELVITQSMLTQRIAEARMDAAAGLELPLEDLNRLTRDLQDSVMAMRAQPVKTVFQRMSRLAREVEAVTGKRVRLVASGEETEVDRTVIERLTDPLTHMIRNAIDHGIEPPAERAAAGKPEEGVVHVSAAHRGGRIVIEVTDDGGGIDRAAVRAIAGRRGLVSDDAALSDEEIDNLIFAPGFSTRSEPSAVSGRGVGMDIVRSGVQALGGRIGVASRPGEGSKFTLSLPLTLAVLDGMVVNVAGHSLVAPLTSLIESVRPRPSDVRRLGPSISLLSFRGAHLPLIDLGVALGYRAAPRDAAGGVVLVVEDDQGGHAAFLVDEILGQRQVVIKSLEANYRAVPGIAAATILGDGRVALILDVDAIAAAHRPGMSEPSPRLATG